jgi:hypothetical protein
MFPRLDREAAARYVLSRHNPGSGYSFYRTPEWGVEEPSAPDTLAALKSLQLLGVEIPERDATARWLMGLQDETGGYSTLTIGWATLLALAEIDARPAQSPAAWLVTRAESFVSDERIRDWHGALRDALHLLEVSRVFDMRFEWQSKRLLEKARDPNGGWAAPGADLETTAIALLLANSDEEDRGIDLDAEDFLRRCEHDTLGLRIAPLSGASSVGALWGGAWIAYHLKIRLQYLEPVAFNLTLAQRSDGGLGPRHAAISTLHDTLLGLETELLLDQW